MIIRRYSELIQIPTFKERFEYLAIGGRVGQYTFGVERFLNQDFYRSKTWRKVRDIVITRDSYNGYPCDLGDPDHPIYGRVIIHHINPITVEDIEMQSDFLLDPEFLICTAELTHKGIHYADFNLLPKDYSPRAPNDTCPWK